VAGSARPPTQQSALWRVPPGRRTARRAARALGARGLGPGGARGRPNNIHIGLLLAAGSSAPPARSREGTRAALAVKSTGTKGRRGASGAGGEQGGKESGGAGGPMVLGNTQDTNQEGGRSRCCPRGGSASLARLGLLAAASRLAGVVRGHVAGPGLGGERCSRGASGQGGGIFQMITKRNGRSSIAGPGRMRASAHPRAPSAAGARPPFAGRRGRPPACCRVHSRLVRFADGREAVPALVLDALEAVLLPAARGARRQPPVRC
jgi:hypothetical protein